MAKANLEWEKSNVAKVSKTPAAQAKVNPEPPALWTAGNVDTGILLQEAMKLTKQLVLISALEHEATEYAVDNMCGEVTWGVCERQTNAGLVREKKQ